MKRNIREFERLLGSPGSLAGIGVDLLKIDKERDFRRNICIVRFDLLLLDQSSEKRSKTFWEGRIGLSADGLGRALPGLGFPRPSPPGLLSLFTIPDQRCFVKFLLTSSGDTMIKIDRICVSNAKWKPVWPQDTERKTFCKKNFTQFSQEPLTSSKEGGNFIITVSEGRAN